MKTLSSKIGVYFALFMALGFAMPQFAQANRGDRRDNEYNLYERNRDHKDFNKYDYPDSRQTNNDYYYYEGEQTQWSYPPNL